MTKTESRIAVGLDELAAWDDANARDYEQQQAALPLTRDLPHYGFDSDKQTLVGLGPARRSRPGSATPDSQRVPQSEPPGPFIADDEEQVPPSWRKRKLSRWPIAVPAAVVATAAAVILIGAFASSATPEPQAAAAAPAPALPEHRDALPAAAPPVEQPEVPSSDPVAAASDAVAVQEQPPASEGETATSAKPAVEAFTPAVKLPELPPPTIVDRSSGTEASVGIINVTSNPPANVVLDGRPIGKAPRVVRVPAGTHKLVFIHPLYGRRSVVVNVRAGVTTGASADF